MITGLPLMVTSLFSGTEKEKDAAYQYEMYNDIVHKYDENVKEGQKQYDQQKKNIEDYYANALDQANQQYEKAKIEFKQMYHTNQLAIKKVNQTIPVDFTQNPDLTVNQEQARQFFINREAEKNGNELPFPEVEMQLPTNLPDQKQNIENQKKNSLNFVKIYQLRNQGKVPLIVQPSEVGDNQNKDIEYKIPELTDKEIEKNIGKKPFETIEQRRAKIDDALNKLGPRPDFNLAEQLKALGNDPNNFANVNVADIVRSLAEVSDIGIQQTTYLTTILRKEWPALDKLLTQFKNGENGIVGTELIKSGNWIVNPTGETLREAGKALDELYSAKNAGEYIKGGVDLVLAPFKALPVIGTALEKTEEGIITLGKKVGEFFKTKKLRYI